MEWCFGAGTFKIALGSVWQGHLGQMTNLRGEVWTRILCISYKGKYELMHESAWYLGCPSTTTILAISLLLASNRIKDYFDFCKSRLTCKSFKDHWDNKRIKSLQMKITSSTPPSPPRQMISSSSRRIRSEGRSGPRLGIIITKPVVWICWCEAKKGKVLFPRNSPASCLGIDDGKKVYCGENEDR